MSDEKLTNLTRFQVKRRFLRSPIVVLQVKVEQDWREWRGPDLHVGTNYYWRDVTPEEFTLLQERNTSIKELARHSDT